MNNLLDNNDKNKEAGLSSLLNFHEKRGKKQKDLKFRSIHASLHKKGLIFLLSFSLLGVGGILSSCGDDDNIKILNPEEEDESLLNEDLQESSEETTSEEDGAMSDAESSASESKEKEEEESRRSEEKERESREEEESKEKEEEESRSKAEKESKDAEEAEKSEKESKAAESKRLEEESIAQSKKDSEAAEKATTATAPAPTQPAYAAAPPATISDEGTTVLADNPLVDPQPGATDEDEDVPFETFIIYDDKGNPSVIKMTYPNPKTGQSPHPIGQDTPTSNNSNSDEVSSAISRDNTAMTSSDSASVDLATSASVIMSCINAERVARNLTPMTNDAVMQEIANARAPYVAASYQASGDTTGHNHGQYSCLAWIGANYGANCAQAENTGFFTQHSETAQQVYLDYYNSPAHAANMFNPQLTRMGVALYNDPDGRTYVVMVFGF